MALDHMKIACVLVTHLAVKAERRRYPVLRGKAFMVVGSPAGPGTNSGQSGQTVLDASPEVTGVAAGMPVREASARCRDAIAVQADESYYRRVFDSLAVALSRRSPSVEQASSMPSAPGTQAPPSMPGTLYVGLSGLDRLYGGDAAAAAALLHAIPYDLEARVGVADGKFPAYVAATMTEPGRASRAPDDTASFLRGASVDLLPVTWDAKVRLHGFGLHTLGDVANLGLGPMQAQFGRDGQAAWELASGIDARPVVPYKADEEIVEELTFPAPATSMNTLLLGTDLLLGRAFARPGLRGKYARTASLQGAVIGRAPWTKNIAFKDAVGSRDRAMTAMKGALAGTALPGALEDLRLTLSGLTGESGIQSSLFADVRKQEQLRETMHQLARRLRARPPVYRVREVEPWSRIPERRQALVHFDP